MEGADGPMGKARPRGDEVETLANGGDGLAGSILECAEIDGSSLGDAAEPDECAVRGQNIAKVVPAAHGG
jgi:hypothetical protein